MIKRKSGGKGYLIFVILVLILIATCLFSSIVFSIPSKTAELYGPANPNLSIRKHITQSIILILKGDQLKNPASEEATILSITIEQGNSLDEILSELLALNLVRHPDTFRAYLIYSGIDTRIQPGMFQFSTAMSELEIAQQLGNPNFQETTISILPGWRVEEIAAALSGVGLEISSNQFLEAVTLQGREGYLFPGSYSVDRDIAAEALVEIFYQEFLSNFSQELEESITSQGLTLHQAVILASIVEREAILDSEMPLIASVFINRLRENLNLAADPTIQYALGYSSESDTWWKNPLSQSDLEIISPYNTYYHSGLPPGPICNPGIRAIEAVADPADSSFLYFRAACDGSGEHLFAETYQEHLNNACP
jgi:UPF0755 protein